MKRKADPPQDKGIIFNIQRFSLQDGPGIRTTVFFKGCPLKCWWCSNPESQAFLPEVAHSNALCKQCGNCTKLCAKQAVSLSERGIRIDRKLCDNCAQCLRDCYSGALKVYGREMTTAEVFEEVEKDVAYYRNSDGGVTLSGGELLSQAGFAISLLRQFKKSGFHTTIDTCGYGEPEAIKEILRHTDLVFFDLKHMDGPAHQRLTGVSNKRILSNFALVAESGIDVVVRIPLIPGMNDSTDDIKAITQSVARFQPVRKIDLLPYHRFGAGKYEMLDRPYLMGSDVAPNRPYIEELKALVVASGFECKIID
jgi:pyruvate formate lyase activating enzyme